MPPWPLEHLLWAAAAVASTWRLAFTRGNIPDQSFKVLWKLELALASPRRTTAPPRVATALELLLVCRELQARFEEVELPLLVVHGGEDTVCDPACAEENIENVFGDTVDWLTSHAAAAAAAAEGHI
ncbi:hypothetical protein ABZP36_026517 [Zizania latifolia]